MQARSKVVSTSFSFYTAEDVRRLSVVQITSPVAFDTLNNPIPGGLYDPKMGPADLGVVCTTCGLTFESCPGHHGRIELSVPVYNPVLFNDCYDLLQRKCLCCHRLRLPRAVVRRFVVKLHLLRIGELVRAHGLDAEIAAATPRFATDGAESSDNGEEMSDDDGADAGSSRIDRILTKYETLIKNSTPKRMDKVVRTAWQATVKEMYRVLPKGKCGTCGALNPGHRKDGFLKIFRKRFNAKQAKTMRDRGLVIRPALAATRRPGEDSDEEDDEVSDEEEAYEGGGSTDTDARPDIYVTPLEVERQLELLYENERSILSLLWNPDGSHAAGNRGRMRRRPAPGPAMYFLRCLPVPPARFRPPMYMDGRQFEHPQNHFMAQILQQQQLLLYGRTQPLVADGAAAAVTVTAEVKQKARNDRINAWIALQEAVNSLMDSQKSSTNGATGGIRQLLEKKQGLFRMNMMGKRVNYACRSVISPDVCIGNDEIGVPLRFALKLSYAEGVTAANVSVLREQVERGALEHPGATHVQDEKGVMVDLSTRDARQRTAIARTLLNCPGKKVWRHLQDGDIMLVNRQPTLHKASMMAHKARVLMNPAQQTIRMHYANCNSYNADFDGDEINLHFPQNEMARAEGYGIVANTLQYLSCKDGKPLRGLIQDHVDAGVLLTRRDCFLDRDTYQQMLFVASTALPGERGAARIPSAPPTILMPRKGGRPPLALWTGKQVLTGLFSQLLSGRPPLTVSSKSRVPTSEWGKGPMSEQMVLVSKNELLRGVIDKNQMGASAFGIVHSVHEMYGPDRAAELLNAFGILFTMFLRRAGHTCGIDDLVLRLDAEKGRSSLVANAASKGLRTAAAHLGVGEKVADHESADGVAALQSEVASELHRRLRHDFAAAGAAIDSAMQGALAPLSSDIIKLCLPHGQQVRFPKNCFSLMVLAGAKGSLVNHSQISCCLGQQSLEGRRVPIMMSGKTLPSFDAWDPSPRAGGLITDRFLSGLRPQEYYFHCMAGREGLVDTAVKTSRSGYLQRCLVKHLEELQVAYDYTVRDGDGAIVQFMYGDDGMGIAKANHLDGSTGASDAQLTFLARNATSLFPRSASFARRGAASKTSSEDLLKWLGTIDIEGALAPPAHVASAQAQDRAAAASAKGGKLSLKVGDLVWARRFNADADGWNAEHLLSGWHAAQVSKAKKAKAGKNAVYSIKYDTDSHIAKKMPVVITGYHSSGTAALLRLRVPDPFIAPMEPGSAVGRHLGAVSEQLASSVRDYVRRNPDGALRAADADGDDNRIDGEVFERLIHFKALRSLIEPGESVGTQAAQSIGEPSTQMTLNTFHLAGHGALNVTLGIPRLREILMTASANISTPTMVLPMCEGVKRDDVDLLAQRLNPLDLEQLITHVKIRESVMRLRKFSDKQNIDQVSWCRRVIISFAIAPAFAVDKHFGEVANWRTICSAFGNEFLLKLMKAIDKAISAGSDGIEDEDEFQHFWNKNGEIADGKSKKKKKKKKKETADGAETKKPVADDSDDDNNSEDDDDEEQGTARFGRKKQLVTYDDDSSSSSSDDDEEEDENEDADSDASEPSKSSAADDGMELDDDASTSAMTLNVHDRVKGHQYFLQAKKIQATNSRSIDVELRFPLNTPKLLLLELVDAVAAKVVIHQINGIEQCVVATAPVPCGNGEKRLCLHTQGVSFPSILSLPEVENFDLQKIYTNDIAALLRTYGVEAAMKAIVLEISGVFAVYGISVNPRHLSLIAASMTKSGGFDAMNRASFKPNSSPFLQMSFETTMDFLTTACTENATDSLTTPSSSIVLGQVVKCGTGAFELRQPLSL